MCRHNWITLKTVRVCTKCGLTFVFREGGFVLDRALPGALRR